MNIIVRSNKQICLGLENVTQIRAQQNIRLAC